MIEWAGGQLTTRARCIVAPNPGPMTLDGTKTYVLAEPGARDVVVVDPGPDDAGHLDRVAAAASVDGRRVRLVLLTHRHLDHSGGAASFAARVGAPVRAVEPALCRDAEPLEPGELEVGGLELVIIPTPGHTSDSVCFVLPVDRSLLTGDTLLGRGPSVVAHPDGRLADYLASLDRLEEVANAYGLDRLLPGHGPAGANPGEVVAAYRNHRLERLAAVQGAVAAGSTSARQIVQTVYADVDRALWPAAEQSVRAQLEYLGMPSS